MPRTIIGGLLGGLALYITGFIFWGTPLSRLAYTALPDAQGAALQLAMAQTLTPSGTGTYIVPDPVTSAGTVLFGQGPVATVHFNTGGFAIAEAGSLLTGLVLALLTGLVIAFALAKVARRSVDRGTVWRVGALFAIAIPFYLHFGAVAFGHRGLGFYLFSFVADTLSFAAAAFTAAWFLKPDGGSAERVKHPVG